MKEGTIVQQCLDMLKKEDIQKELKLLLKPISDFVFYEIYPYVYMILILVFVLFIMIVSILILLILLLRNKNSISSSFPPS
jgi:hypothetical protein